jgi:phosphoenolpyruvate synthase/pyruvate phosphate dikinase
MGSYVRRLDEIDGACVREFGGKGAGLGALTRIPGVHVPEGFCVSTAAFEQALDTAPSLRASIAQLARLGAGDLERIQALSAEIRGRIEGLSVPAGAQREVLSALAGLGERGPWAVRSSATGEDQPDASSAGQLDSFLNVTGAGQVLAHLRRCWASLFSEQAVSYRLRRSLDPGPDQGEVGIAVLVQRLIVPEAAGVLFTADPVSGSRKVTCIEAVLGLGEALVAGRAAADRYRVRAGRIVEAAIASKTLEVRPGEGGGTVAAEVAPARRGEPALTDAQLLALERLGRALEAHLGGPQDVEWCLADGQLYVVQSRPITTLYPIPATGLPGDRVFLSVGHQQMMTDAMKPLGLSLFQATAARPMYAAGGRLFVDPTAQLADPTSRAALLAFIGRSEPLFTDALTTLLERGDFLPAAPATPAAQGPGRPAGPPPPAAAAPAEPAELSALIKALIEEREASLEALRRDIGERSGPALLDFILEDTQRLKRSLTDPRRFGAIMAGMNAAAWLNAQLLAWLGEERAADTLSLAAPGNVTAEMGLALLDLADALRPWPEVTAYLRGATDSGFLEGLEPLEGGAAARGAIAAFLERYGVRCAGEIDVTRPRWCEQPTALVPLLLSHVERLAPGEARRRFEAGRRAAAGKERDLLGRLEALPDGSQKAAEAAAMIRQLRASVGYREHPKYDLVCRFFVYKQALLREGEALARAGVLQAPGDIAYLTLEELREVSRSRSLDPARIAQRRREHASNRRLTPPRVITYDGEVLSGTYRRSDLPPGALAGQAVSPGVVEGRARVVLDMADADLKAEDILVTRFTDPSWTPLFLTIRGLVTEIGGTLTHGAVIAREYGLPAIIGVQRATERIRDGQRVRLDGVGGWVELLEA